LSKVALADRH